MSESGGLGKQQNNPADTKSVRVFRMLKLDTMGKKKKTTTQLKWPGIDT